MRDWCGMREAGGIASRIPHPSRIAVVNEVAGMAHHPREPQRAAALQLACETLDALPPQHRIRRSEIDQIAVVRHDRLDARALETRAKPIRHLRGDDGGASPLRGVRWWVLWSVAPS